MGSKTKKWIKSILVRTDNEQVYSIEAHRIAHHRATYYEDERDDHECPVIFYNRYFLETITSEKLLKDWLLDNNWYEFDPVLIEDNREDRLARLTVTSCDVIRSE